MAGEGNLDSLITISMGLIFTGALINFIYNLKIGGFFSELEENDPEAWKNLGYPRKGDNFRAVRPGQKGTFAFVPVLREKAGLPGYPRSRNAWFWFKIAAVFTTTLLLLVSIMVTYTIINDVF